MTSPSSDFSWRSRTRPLRWLWSGLALILLPGFAQDSQNSLGNKSSVHYDVTRAFAICVGLSQQRAETIAQYNEATDQGQYGDATVTFATRWAPPPLGQPGAPNYTFFHVPSLGDLDEIYAWAVQGEPLSPPLSSADADALAGTDAAFGVYLHALGDRYSHLACSTRGVVPHPSVPMCVRHPPVRD